MTFIEAWRPIFGLHMPLAAELRMAFSDRWMRVDAYTCDFDNTPSEETEAEYLTRSKTLGDRLLGTGNEIWLLLPVWDAPGSTAIAESHPYIQSYAADPVWGAWDPDRPGTRISFFGVRMLWDAASFRDLMIAISCGMLHATLFSPDKKVAICPGEDGFDIFFANAEARYQAIQYLEELKSTPRHEA